MTCGVWSMPEGFESSNQPTVNRPETTRQSIQAVRTLIQYGSRCLNFNSLDDLVNLWEFKVKISNVGGGLIFDLVI